MCSLRENCLKDSKRIQKRKFKWKQKHLKFKIILLHILYTTIIFMDHGIFSPSSIIQIFPFKVVGLDPSPLSSPSSRPFARVRSEANLKGSDCG